MNRTTVLQNTFLYAKFEEKHARNKRLLISTDVQSTTPAKQKNYRNTLSTEFKQNSD